MKPELLAKINKIDGLKGKIKYTSAVIDKKSRSIAVGFFSDSAITDKEKSSIQAILIQALPSSFKNIEVDVKKIVTLDSFVTKEALTFLKKEHSIACADILDSDVSVKLDKGVAEVELKLESSVYSFFQAGNICNELKQHLESCFIEDFTVRIFDNGKTEANTLILNNTASERDIDLASDFKRTLKVKDVTKYFDDDTTDTATYIADTYGMLGEVYLAGTISSVRELVTKTGKPYFLIEFGDRTGSVTGAVFPLKAQLAKAKKLAEGVQIIARCEFYKNGEYRNLRINSINLCIFPDNFVPASRPKKPVPSAYSLIFPQSLRLENQENFLVDKSVPECLIGREFVVFDFETTGTDFDDKITEIGAVRIVDGVIKESFQTLVNPLKHIPQQVVAITGINDEMVKDAPLFKAVCPDFYKFCYGATIVAHNIEFDSRFLRNEAKLCDYLFDNPKLDTLQLARESINGVANYRLNTLCDKFGIVFRHHRALSDALATGELLIEIARIRKKLP